MSVLTMCVSFKRNYNLVLLCVALDWYLPKTDRENYWVEAFCFKLNSVNTGIHVRANFSSASDVTSEGHVAPTTLQFIRKHLSPITAYRDCLGKAHSRFFLHRPGVFTPLSFSFFMPVKKKIFTHQNKNKGNVNRTFLLRSGNIIFLDMHQSLHRC